MKRLPAYLLAVMTLQMLGVWSAAEGQAFRIKCPTGYDWKFSSPSPHYQECRSQHLPICKGGEYKECRNCLGAHNIDRCLKLISPICDLPPSEQKKGWKVLVKNGPDICTKPRKRGDPAIAEVPKPVKCFSSTNKLAIDRNGQPEDKCVPLAKDSEEVTCSLGYQLLVLPGRDDCISRVKPTFVPK